MDFLKRKHDFVDLIIKHIGTSAIMDLLLRLLTCIEPPQPRQEVLNVSKMSQRTFVWCVNCKMAYLLLILLSLFLNCAEIKYVGIFLLGDASTFPVEPQRWWGQLRTWVAGLFPLFLISTLKLPDAVLKMFWTLLNTFFWHQKVYLRIIPKAFFFTVAQKH